MTTNKMTVAEVVTWAARFKYAILFNVALLVVAVVKGATTMASEHQPTVSNGFYATSGSSIDGILMPKQEWQIDILLPIPKGFKSVAKIEKIDFPSVFTRSKHLYYQRRIVTVSLPPGLSTEDIDANLRAEARYAFEEGAMSVKVVAYETNRLVGVARPIAKLTFAPHGGWENTSRFYNLDEYQAVIWHP